MEKGIVYFVGAGPGDVSLITEKGSKALKEADVVIYDRLVNPAFLSKLRPNCKLIYCGKKPCQHTLRQEDIEKELIIQAKKGKKVVRLKGGDPSVLGRVGEEIESLLKESIHYEIIPGITAGIGAATYSGVPVTYRNEAGSFAIITAHHSAEHNEERIQWKEISSAIDTLIFYMGMRLLPEICRNLLEKGKSSSTPVMITQWGTYSKQKIVTGDLSSIQEKSKAANMTNPAVIIIGEVVAHQKDFAWYSNRLLSGHGIVVSDSTQSYDEVKDKVQFLGADFYQIPFLTEEKTVKEEEMESSVIQLNSTEQVVFLSKRSAVHFIEGLIEFEYDLRHLMVTIAAVDDEAVDYFKSIGIQSKKINIQKVKHNSSFLIGTELDFKLNSFLRDTNNSLITSKHTIHEKDRQAWLRLLEEGHITSLYLPSKKEAVAALLFLENESDSVKNQFKDLIIIGEDHRSEVFFLKEKLKMDYTFKKNAPLDHFITCLVQGKHKTLIRKDA